MHHGACVRACVHASPTPLAMRGPSSEQRPAGPARTGPVHVPARTGPVRGRRERTAATRSGPRECAIFVGYTSQPFESVIRVGHPSQPSESVGHPSRCGGPSPLSAAPCSSLGWLTQHPPSPPAAPRPTPTRAPPTRARAAAARPALAELFKFTASPCYTMDGSKRLCLCF